MPLYLIYAYISYLSVKTLKVSTNSNDYKKNNLSSDKHIIKSSIKALEHSFFIADYINAILSYAFTAVIYSITLLITPIVWATDKISSKLDEIKEPEKLNKDTVQIK
ncbi:hypothetical protein [Wolbachia endosymbiont of Pentidionis agamae]|uniref:hypothetical protein n=1 Tax=Wolbachia endosymbiont of Pentidionis agamae TaxID=3110435 RepID=UPI002FD7557E